MTQSVEAQIVEAQIEVLGEIKKIDEIIFRLQTEIDHIPASLEKLEIELSSKREVFEKAKNVYEDHKKKLREAEGDLKSHDDKISKAEEKLMEVKTNEAYSAAMTEINNQKAEKAKVEDRILGLMTELEGETRTFKEAEAAFTKEEDIFKKGKAELDEENRKLSEQLKELNDKKDEIARRLEPSAATLYQRISKRVHGSPVVEVASGMCMGCHIRIRPQLYNEIIGFVSVKQCPSCGKILIPAPRKPSGAENHAAE